MIGEATTSDQPAFSVIIPARDEAATMARCLQSVYADAPRYHRMQVIVAANGCSDRTVEIARKTAPNALILDIPEGSKTRAMNSAHCRALYFPYIYLDADVQCEYASLAALAMALRQTGVMTAAPAIRTDLSQCNRWMKAYYRAWTRQPYAIAGNGGAGCFGLSEAALAQIGQFPPIIGDDIWIHTRFPDEAKRYVAADAAGHPVFSVVHPPRTAWQQIKVEARRQNGNAEVKRLYLGPYCANAINGGGFRTALCSGTHLGDLAVFFTIKLAARLLAWWQRKRGRDKIWARDTSTRQA